MSGILVNFDPYSKTGNRLCQFAFGKILSLKKKIPFSSLPIPGFINTYNCTDNIHATPNIIKTLEYGAHYVDYNNLLATTDTIVINSYVQKYRYYIEHINFLRTLFVIEQAPKINVDSDELVIHIRGTDYCDGNVHIDDKVYLDILDKISPSKAALVTDNINTSVVEELCKKNVRVVTQTNLTNKGNGFNEYEIYDFVYMLKAKNLLISQSTFSWWAAFLGHQDNVYVPYLKSKNCMWNLNPGLDDIDLIPPDNKYKKLIYE